MTKTAQSNEQLAQQVDPDEGWETVAEEAPDRIIFDTIGDQFTGWYRGETEEISPGRAAAEDAKPFKLYLFRSVDDGGTYAINQSWALVHAMEKVKVGDLVRITYIKDVPTSRKLQDMKSYRVEVKR